ncbi:hypothetical protein X739_32250 [Mesorhizobium sp. LNHC220B00]|nr:hypothetical protein X739_32250 [Mesorhizobium sp. LNHC220B00]
MVCHRSAEEYPLRLAVLPGTVLFARMGLGWAVVVLEMRHLWRRRDEILVRQYWEPPSWSSILMYLRTVVELTLSFSVRWDE